MVRSLLVLWFTGGAIGAIENVLAAPGILSKYPANGSLSADSCGPFGITFDNGPLDAHEDMIRVVGSRTGLHLHGDFTLIADSLYFVPDIPFAAGETVEILLSGDLAAGGDPIEHGLVWRAMIRPRDELLLPPEIDPASFDLDPLPLQACESVRDWAWGDCNADGRQECVLLMRSLGEDYLLQLVTSEYDDVNDRYQWFARMSVPSADNPYDLEFCNLNDDRKQELILLCLDTVLVWTGIGVGRTPEVADAVEYALPVNHPAKLLVGDVNSDGYQDVVVIEEHGSGQCVLLNDGNGQLNPVQPPPVPRGVGRISDYVTADLGDLNDDGWLDVCWGAEVEQNNLYHIYVRKGLGDGTFDPAISVVAKTKNPVLVTAMQAIEPEPTGSNLLAVWPHSPNLFINIWGYEFDLDMISNETQGLIATGIVSQQQGITLTNSFVDLGDQSSFPELIYTDPASGSLAFIQLENAPGIVDWSWALDEPGLSLVCCGDLDYDTDVDIAVVNPLTSMLTVYSTFGCISGQCPGPETPCDSTVDFGVAEVDCVCETQHLIFRNNSQFQASIVDLIINNGNASPFSAVFDDGTFSHGCNDTQPYVDIIVEFCADDIGFYSDPLEVQILWEDMDHAGNDSLVICEYTLAGTGGRFAGNDLGTDFLNLIWNGNAYVLTGGDIDFGTRPAIPAASETRVISYHNSGSFPVIVEPLLLPDPPFSIAPGQQIVDPNDTAHWSVSVNPAPVHVPPGVDCIDIEESISWSVSPLDPIYCLEDPIADYTLRVCLCSTGNICVEPDPDCDGVGNGCQAEVTAVYCYGDPLLYCLQLSGWDWPGADPVEDFLGTLPDWLTYEKDDLTIILSSDSVVEDADVTLVLADEIYPTIATDFEFHIRMNPDPILQNQVANDGWFFEEGCGCGQLDPGNLEWCLVAGTEATATFSLVYDDALDNITLEKSVVSFGGFAPEWVSWQFDPDNDRQGILTVSSPDADDGDCDGDVAADITICLTDSNCHRTSIKTAHVRVVPDLPDLQISSIDLLPIGVGESIVQHRPFYADVQVLTSDISVDGAAVSLVAGTCGCSLELDDPGDAVVDLEPDVPLTIRYVVESCDDCGSCLFEASIAHPQGNSFDRNPSNNTLATNQYIPCNQAPEIEFMALELIPADQNIQNCGPGYGTNNPNQLTALVVRENDRLEMTAEAQDPDGDVVRLAIVGLGAELASFMSANANIQQTSLDIALNPTDGITGNESCRHFGQLVFQATEIDGTGLSTSYPVEVFVKSDWPDLSVELTTVPEVITLKQEFTIDGTVHCAVTDCDDFTAELLVVDMTGQVVASGSIDGVIGEGETRSVGPMTASVTEPGEHCIRITVDATREVNPANNEAQYCLSPVSGPFVVRPNVVTPNGDGRNDIAYFYFDNQVLQTPKLVIYDLFGEPLYETRSLDQLKRLAWTGKKNSGELVQPGSYIFIIYDNSRKCQSGNLGVVR